MEHGSATEGTGFLPPVVARMELGGVVLGGVSDRERQMPCVFPYVWKLKNKIEQEQTHRYGERGRLPVGAVRRAKGLGRTRG